MSEKETGLIVLEDQVGLAELREAKEVLTHRGMADRLTELIGMPVTATMRMLPDAAEGAVHGAIEKALRTALNVAVKTLGDENAQRGAAPRLLSHKWMAGLTGAAGGAFGMASVAAELPVSTLLILRSVADIARSQGEDLSDLETRLACLEVFALGAGNERSPEGEGDESREIGYFAVRAGLAKHTADAAKYMAKSGALDASAPPLVRLVGEIGKRFGIVVSEKLAAQAIPVVGAVGGALINTYFIDHYQELARAHFTVRRLERTHGPAAIRATYESL
ncbi:EcsC family protein [Roseimaritima sediminicola]|uniref:EcsC family protein n=1 Tax=Roseimaritima sediminicola TaxID=2662066 RepID=UPI001F1F0B1C|nr:EcsC family protein [Roseimaritima sediminicola]